MFGATVTTALLVSDLIALLLTRRPLSPPFGRIPQSPASLARHYFDRSHQPLGLRADEIDRQQPLREFGAQHLHTLGKQEAALKLPGRDAAMQIFPRLVLLLPATNRELVLLDRDLDLTFREAGYGERDPQFFRLGAIGHDPLDIVGRIAVCPRLRDLV